MAQANKTPIQLYYSTTLGAAPSNANLLEGELAINIRDGKLYYKDESGVVQVIATKGAGTIGGSNTQIQYNNNGALAGSVDMTYTSGTNTVLLTRLNLTNALGAIYGGTGLNSYTTGDLLYSSASNTLAKLAIGTANYILTVNSAGTNVQWSAPSSISVSTATNLAGGVAGSVPYQSAASTTTFLGIGAADRVMTSSGSAPQWVTALTGLTGVSSSSITNTSLTSGRVVYSGTGGLETDSANLTFNGTTLTTTGLSNSGTSALVRLVTVGDTSFNGATVFAAATPAKLYMGTGTATDTTSAIGATNAVGAVASLAITPIAATNTSVTYTNASTLYIAGAPSAGTNITITNPYALYIAAGNVYLGAGTANGVAYLDGSKVLTTGSALVFDGSNLGLGVTPSAWGSITKNIEGGSGSLNFYSTSQLWLTQNAVWNSGWTYKTTDAATSFQQYQGGYYWYQAVSGTAGNAITFTQAMTLDASGNLGIGVTAPSYPLDVKLANNQFILARESTSNITNGFRIGGVNNEAKAVFSANSATGEVNLGAINTNYFLTFSTNGANERLRIPVAGGVQAVTTISVGNATPSASGAGITFPATQSASTDANTLDDYEEGTWLPTLTGDGGGTAMTYTSQIGKYTKIGNVVIADAYILLSAKGTITGNAVITGLPLPPGLDSYNSAINWGYWANLGANWMSVGGWLNTGNTIYLGGRKTAGAGIETLLSADIANNSRINVQLIYTV